MGMGLAILQRRWVGRGTGGGFTVIASRVLDREAPAPGFVKAQKQFYGYFALSFEGLKKHWYEFCQPEAIN